MLQPYASDPDRSRGRLFPEEESAFRTCFQRDRDRIIHSSAFRRLKHKTQVFIEHEGDHFRTRLTHSLEVSQVARTIARVLGLNEELTEAVALAHDLGHPPFGHTGEEALQRLMKDHGGFDHNAQAIRIVTGLERHYASFDGLNLTWETLEGIAKHNGPVAGEVPIALAEYDARHDLELGSHASAEAQAAAVADDIAYNSHDLHDGLRAGLFHDDGLAELPYLDMCYASVDYMHPGLDEYRRNHEALRCYFGIMVEDVVNESRRRIAELDPRNPGDVRRAGRPVVDFAKQFQRDMNEVRDFLHRDMYRAPVVVREREMAAYVVEDLFSLYMSRVELLPEEWREDVEAAKGDGASVARIVTDYISGMTDRFALQCHERHCRDGA